jgi:hypothetical protein
VSKSSRTNILLSLVTTTHVLTEASNLLGAEKDPVRIAGREAMKEYVKQCHEQTDPAALLVDEPEYQRLGLTDVAIKVASALPAFVLTADVLLYVHLCNSGVEVVNFNHLRQGYWL